MHIDNELISKLEKLAMLNLGEQEKKELVNDLEEIIEMMEIIKNTKLDEDPLYQLNPHSQYLREDEAKSELTTKEALANAPHKIDRFFAVPKVIKQ